MKKRIVSLLALLVLAPTPLFAQSTDIAAQIAGLQAQLAALMQQLTSMQTGAPVTTPPAAYQPVINTGSGQSVCPSPAITRNLSYGMQGADIAGLQAFLISAGYLAAGNTTGFFGNLTQSAVQRFQAAQGLASSGSPSTTGYGSIGPRTRQAISQLCGAPSTPTLPGGLPVVISQFSATPSQISSGQAATLVWSVQNAASCIITQQVPGFPLVTLSASAGPSGSLIAYPSSTSIYSLICTSFGAGVGASLSTTVTVGSTVPNSSSTTTPDGNNPFLSINALPPQVTTGQTATLSWSTSRVSSCTVTSVPAGLISSTALSGTQLLTFSTSATTTYMFNLNCIANNTSYASSTAVRVTRSIPYEISNTGTTQDGYGSATISQAKTRTGTGETFSVQWSSSGMNSCVITKYTPGVAPYMWCDAAGCGTNGTNPTTATTLGVHSYVLRCSGLHGQATALINHVVQQESTGGTGDVVTFSASQSSGPSPLGVTFSGSVPGSGYTIAFGDGTSNVSASCTTATPCANGRISINTAHTYAQPGVYTARLSCTGDACAGGSDTIVISVTQGNGSNFTFSTPLSGTTIGAGQNLPIGWSTLNAPSGSKVRLEVYEVGQTVNSSNNDKGLTASTNELPTSGTYFWPIMIGGPMASDAGYSGFTLQGGRSYRIVGKLYSGSACWGYCTADNSIRTIYSTAESNTWTIGSSTATTLAVTKSAGPTLAYRTYANTWAMSATPPSGTTLAWKAEWGDGDITDQSGGTFTHTYNIAGTFNPKFTATASNGSSGFLTVPLVVVNATTTAVGPTGTYYGVIVASPTSGPGPLVARFDAEFPIPEGSSGVGYLNQIVFGDGSQAIATCSAGTYGGSKCVYTSYHFYRYAGTYDVELYGSYNCPPGVSLCVIGAARIIVSGSMLDAGDRCRVTDAARGGNGNGADNINHGTVIALRNYYESSASYICNNGTWYCYDKSCPLGETENY